MAESGTSSNGTRQQPRAQDTTGGNKNESADLFMRKLKMAAEKKVGATKAELFCKTFEEVHKKLVYKELNIDAAQRFLNAYEKGS
ncbi:uncharacterized protein LOC107304516 isoform X2 [Oryza brachyantha]|uniref:uncharacterized protein LOC107304516 isoform X2 n=1 Tax=Oryza brachyantha TaxID=4533 RepID=UPI0007764FFF|nr:uncharacterized protein LOC107304516 isoform X2 [Oryza brachyantha]